MKPKHNPGAKALGTTLYRQRVVKARKGRAQYTRKGRGARKES